MTSGYGIGAPINPPAPPPWPAEDDRDVMTQPLPETLLEASSIISSGAICSVGSKLIKPSSELIVTLPDSAELMITKVLPASTASADGSVTVNAPITRNHLPTPAGESTASANIWSPCPSKRRAQIRDCSVASTTLHVTPRPAFGLVGLLSVND
ncbi:hypothetical protein D3C85_1142020 [compost metagenome]